MKLYFLVDPIIPRGGKVILTFRLKSLAVLCRGKLLVSLVKGQSCILSCFRMSKIFERLQQRKNDRQ